MKLVLYNLKLVKQWLVDLDLPFLGELSTETVKFWFADVGLSVKSPC